MAQTYDTRLTSIASHYIRLLNTRVTDSTIRKDIEEHAYYPSLLSLSDTFDKYRISNQAVRVTADELDELPLPFVAYAVMRDIGKDFALVTNITEETVTFLHRNGRPQTMPKQAFKNIFQGVAWAAEADELSGDKDFEEKRRAEKRARLTNSLLIAAGVMIGAIVLVLGSPGDFIPAFAGICLIKALGLTVTILLLLFEIDKSNSFIKNICAAGGASNCAAVLNSRASKIAGISWSEVGFFYFGATSLLLLSPYLSFAARTAWLAAANVVAVPYIFFSIYFQWRVIRQWCVLCLTTQALLVVELIWSILNYWRHPQLPEMSVYGLLSVLVCLALPVVGWYSLKSSFQKARDHRLFVAAYRRLQYNPDIFTSLLRQQPEAPEGWQGLGLQLGSFDPAITIIKVCNPYCRPCSEAHAKLEGLLEQHREVQVRIFYNLRNIETEKGLPIVKHFLAIAARGDSALTKWALDDWYRSDARDYAAFAARYPVGADELEESMDQINRMREWCVKAEVYQTPTIFIAGFRLPEMYQIEDVSYIIPKLQV